MPVSLACQAIPSLFRKTWANPAPFDPRTDAAVGYVVLVIVVAYITEPQTGNLLAAASQNSPAWPESNAGPVLILL